MKTRITYNLKKQKYTVQFSKYWFSLWEDIFEADFYAPAQLYKDTVDVAIHKHKEGKIIWEQN